MARNHRLPPSAACLSASMRDLGYSLESAIADIIDNSISANATAIDIVCNLTGATPSLAIIDNGWGMSADEIVQAMRHGASDPKAERGPKDLGRFGLGLKTASFSQCRTLTVASAKDGRLGGAVWSLDRIDELDDWMLSILEEDDLAALDYADRLGQNGTAVIWTDLDRLFEDESGPRRDEIVNEKLGIVERHLSLVFHRFLSGEVKGRKKIAISVNGHPVAPFDPFCRKNTATQILPEEVVYVGGVAVQMQPFILPHHSRLSASEYDFYQNRSDFISNQGAYIYRNGRLMAWGDWFRLIPKGEATKLARVQIDFPNSLDESWTIDIKKSRARPPHAVRERLRQIIAQISGRSTTVHRGRGQRLFEETAAPLWERFADHGGIRYGLNSQHPLIESLRAKLTRDEVRSLNIILDSVAASLPVEMIYSDYSTSPREFDRADDNPDEALEKLRSLHAALCGEGPVDTEAFLQIVKSTRLFEGQMDVAEKYVKEFLA
ncbi:ATP-binding protein [Qipengyuania spongiae]|uniref:ATP-binding protein n=1 Tax=Qipengyuania spongiae TaxID=2909673 RepID=A0ABY5T3W9_9SPHN|nr:ATP-binding protein [Qipengyuania spongiae]UVI39679.1 ATP-binding protein [Qipengyuania spongiae]